jgi:hypothetical protein
MIVAKSEKQNPAFEQRLCGVAAITNDQNSRTTFWTTTWPTFIASSRDDETVKMRHISRETACEATNMEQRLFAITSKKNLEAAV